MKQLIAQGAEAKIFAKENKIIKDRFRKKYRHAHIDEKLRKERTRREAKVLNKLEAINFPAPKCLKHDQKSIIDMEMIKGPLVKDILEKKDYKKLSREIGKKIAILHNNLIIHGDLTTSNMIFNKEVYFIDYGLSFFSEKDEDRAVDLHLLKEAFESKHYKIWETCFQSALQGYKKTAKHATSVLKRLAAVEKRGRHKQKY